MSLSLGGVAEPEVSLHEVMQSVWRDLPFPSWHTALGACLALYVFGRQLSEKRPPGNIMAWGMMMLLAPLPGLVLFMLFGARKRAQTTSIRLQVSRVAGLLKPYKNENSADLHEGNRVTLLADADGTATFLNLREQILRASSSIHLLTYIFGNDATGREILKLLADRARQGVRVRLLVDALGSRPANDSLFEDFIKAGGRFERFMPVAPWKARSSANLRNHRKLAVFDGKRAIIGGQNLALEYMGATPSRGRFRDFGALVEGPAAAAFARIFAADWCFASGEDPETLKKELSVKPSPEGSSRVEVVAGGPDFLNDPVWETLVMLAADCRKEILVATPYLVPDEVLLRILAAKARSGKKVKIITPKKSDHRFLDFARRRHLKALREAGAKVFFHDGSMLHGKLFIVDREVVVLGSANLDMRSLFVNFELATVVRDKALVAEALKLAESLERESRPEKPPANKALSLKERLLEHLAHLAAPLL